ncbi:MAG: hypothetical protein ACRCSN_17105 [Dermatophilaceae bacterium]
MADPMERLLDIRDDIDRTMQSYEAAAAARTDVEGSDASGAVTVRVGRTGILESVRIRADWSRRITPDQLGSAVTAAVGDAAARSGLVWGDALAESLDAPRPTTRPLPSVDGSLAAGLSDVADPQRLVEHERASLEAMAEVLGRMLSEIDMVADEVEAIGRRHVVGVADGGDIRVVLSGAGGFVRVEIAEAAARHHAANLCRLVKLAYDDAVRQVGDSPVDEVIERSVFGELRRIGSDPAAVVQRFSAI